MNNLVKHAERELDLAGMTADGHEYNAMMRKHILHMVTEFSKEGHSGFSASYATNALNRLLRFEPLLPLTGDDSEWNDDVGNGVLQNNRCSRVFKDASGSYDSVGKVFTEHYYDADGAEQTSSFQSSESRVMVTFPYTPKTEYVDVGFRS